MRLRTGDIRDDPDAHPIHFRQNRRPDMASSYFSYFSLMAAVVERTKKS
ncbi:MAG: hypothetical protein LBT62_03800 [Deltaproteobacteria bacterium]|jgi:hypothetical protein|nr:hypothetical protein [Deltaproteobacteria bacterium]